MATWGGIRDLTRAIHQQRMNDPPLRASSRAQPRGFDCGLSAFGQGWPGLVLSNVHKHRVETSESAAAPSEAVISVDRVLANNPGQARGKVAD